MFKPISIYWMFHDNWKNKYRSRVETNQNEFRRGLRYSSQPSSFSSDLNLLVVDLMNKKYIGDLIFGYFPFQCKHLAATTVWTLPFGSHENLWDWKKLFWFNREFWNALTNEQKKCICRGLTWNVSVGVSKTLINHLRIETKFVARKAFQIRMQMIARKRFTHRLNPESWLKCQLSS